MKAESESGLWWVRGFVDVDDVDLGKAEGERYEGIPPSASTRASISGVGGMMVDKKLEDKC